MAAAQQHGSDIDKTMDMPAHRAMFSGFLKVTEWFCVALAMLLALTVFAFAMGLGWWTGLIAWLVVGLAAGFLLNMGGAWWAFLGISTVLMAIGGAVTFGVMALT